MLLWKSKTSILEGSSKMLSFHLHSQVLVPFCLQLLSSLLLHQTTHTTGQGAASCSSKLLYAEKEAQLLSSATAPCPVMWPESSAIMYSSLRSLPSLPWYTSGLKVVSHTYGWRIWRNHKLHTFQLSKLCLSQSTAAQISALRFQCC